MIIQVNTDGNIEGKKELVTKIQTEVGNSLTRFRDQITRVEVHLSDENSDKKFGTEDMRCLLEARLAGFRPFAVSHQATTLDQALDGAVDKLISSLETTLGKQDDQQYGSSSDRESGDQDV